MEVTSKVIYYFLIRHDRVLLKLKSFLLQSLQTSSWNHSSLEGKIGPISGVWITVLLHSSLTHVVWRCVTLCTLCYSILNNRGFCIITQLLQLEEGYFSVNCSQRCLGAGEGKTATAWLPFFPRDCQWLLKGEGSSHLHRWGKPRVFAETRNVVVPLQQAENVTIILHFTGGHSSGIPLGLGTVQYLRLTLCLATPDCKLKTSIFIFL